MDRWLEVRRRLQERIRPLLADRRIYMTKLRPTEIRARLTEQLPPSDVEATAAPRRLLPKRPRATPLAGSVAENGFVLWKATRYGIEQAAIATGGFDVAAGRTWIVVRVDFLKGWYGTLLTVSLLPVLLALGGAEALAIAALGLAVHAIGFAVEYRRARVQGRFLRRVLAETLFADEVPLAATPRILQIADTWPRRPDPAGEVPREDAKPAR